MMLISLAYLIGCVIIGNYFYINIGGFKKLSDASMTRLDRSIITGKKKVNQDDAELLRSVSFTTFLVVGIFIWIYSSITIGRVASIMTDHFILKWINYIFMYLLFLRLPFRYSNRLIKKRYVIKKFPEKLFFKLIMLTFYILSICCYEKLPKLFNWFLIYLD